MLLIGILKAIAKFLKIKEKEIKKNKNFVKP